MSVLTGEGDQLLQLNPVLANIVKRIITESKGQIQLTSGFRTFDEQRNLYKKYLSGHGNLAAKPGTSRHEHGLAVDLGGNLDLAAKLAEKYGLRATVPGEPWHFELDEESPALQGQDLDLDLDGWFGQLGMNFDPGPEVNPEETLLNRLNLITSMMGLDPMTDMQPVEIDPFTNATAEGHPDPTMASFPDNFINTDMPGGIPDVNYSPPGEGVSKWREVAEAALAYTKSPREWLPSLMRRMAQESRGDPRALNMWDSNARRGTPSKGLMQTIDPTFNTHAGELRGRGVWDPFANIVASIRYTVDRYGSGPAGWDRSGGY